MVECNCLTYGGPNGAPHHVSRRTWFRHLQKDKENSERVLFADDDDADDEEDLYGEGKPIV
jgi:hypothetical protein